MNVIIRMTVAKRVTVDFPAQILCQFLRIQIGKTDIYSSLSTILGLGRRINVIFKILKKQTDSFCSIRACSRRLVRIKWKVLIREERGYGIFIQLLDIIQLSPNCLFRTGISTSTEIQRGTYQQNKATCISFHTLLLNMTKKINNMSQYNYNICKM